MEEASIMSSLHRHTRRMMEDTMKNNFDRDFRRATRGIGGIAILGVLLQLALYGAIIWGIVKLVMWVTS